MVAFYNPKLYLVNAYSKFDQNITYSSRVIWSVLLTDSFYVWPCTQSMKNGFDNPKLELRPSFTNLTSALPWSRKNGIWQSKSRSYQYQCVLKVWSKYSRSYGQVSQFWPQLWLHQWKMTFCNPKHNLDNINVLLYAKFDQTVPYTLYILLS